MLNIILNSHFLRSSVAIQKSAKGMGRYWLECVYITDTDTDRIYYATDGHVLIYLKEPIEHKQLDGTIALAFDKFPKTRRDAVDVNLMETGEAIVHTEKETVVLKYYDKDNVNKEKFESIQQILNGEKIKKFKEPVKEFVLFQPSVLKMCFDYMGSCYSIRPLAEETGFQYRDPILWANSDKTQCCIVMPYRLGER